MTIYVENHTVSIHTDGSTYSIKFEYDADGETDNKGAVIIADTTAMNTPGAEQMPDCPMMTEEQWLLIRKAVDNMFNAHRNKQL